MKRIPKADFLCVGDEGAPVEFGGVRIVFAGFAKDSSQMPAWYHAADIYFHPSRADTAPYSVLEAMATRLPVVATSVGGIPEQVEDGRTGYLVAPGDSEAMAARLAELLAKPEKAAAMGKRGRDRAVKQFDFKELTEEFIEWIQELSTQ
jgi:glycosyltransferase involved in cell wall biosynthesis